MSLVDENGNPILLKPTPEEEMNKEEPDDEESTSESVKLEDLEKGYIVGIKKTGELILQPIHSTNLSELLGLHQLAAHRLQAFTDTLLGYGPPLVLNQLNPIGQLLNQVLHTNKTILQMLTEQTKINMFK